MRRRAISVPGLDQDDQPAPVAVTVTGVAADRPSPRWLQRRVQLAGMRPISLAVDITNYVMLETGQPIHAYDGDRLSGPIVVRVLAITPDGRRLLRRTRAASSAPDLQSVSKPSA